jgi:hypothetical protein
VPCYQAPLDVNTAPPSLTLIRCGYLFLGRLARNRWQKRQQVGERTKKVGWGEEGVRRRISDPAKCRPRLRSPPPIAFPPSPYPFPRTGGSRVHTRVLSTPACGGAHKPHPSCFDSSSSSAF